MLRLFHYFLFSFQSANIVKHQIIISELRESAKILKTLSFISESRAATAGRDAVSG